MKVRASRSVCWIAHGSSAKLGRSTLRTMEEIFGVTPFLGDAANETDLSDLFTVFP
jgi:hypothetical protein